MVQRQTWVKLSDSSQAQWLNVFHLYGGFNRKTTSSGFRIKGSVRVIQPILDPYKGFTVKRINKGKVGTALLVRQCYQFKHRSGFSVTSLKNGGVMLKNDSTFLSDHILGPCFSLVRRKRMLGLFRAVI